MPRATEKGARHFRLKCEIYRLLEKNPEGLPSVAIHEALSNSKVKKWVTTNRQTTQILLRMKGVEKIGSMWLAGGKSNIYALLSPEDFVHWLDEKIVTHNTREELRDILEGRKINDP